MQQKQRDNKRPVVYLAGPIDYVDGESAAGWREKVTALDLFDVVDPQKVGRAVGVQLAKFANDALLPACDGLLVRVDPTVPSWGTPYEVAMASEVLGLPMVFITNEDGELPPLYYQNYPATSDPRKAALLLLRAIVDAPAKRVPAMQHSGGGIAHPALPGDVGYDLRVLETTIVQPAGHGWTKIPIGDETGHLHLAASAGTWLSIWARSSLVMKGLMVAPTVIDEGYRGPIFLFAATITGEPMKLEAGMRVAQALVFPAVTPDLIQRDELPKSERGANGFGSTGV